MKSLSCAACRSRKVLCDRTTPSCKRCLAGNKQCQYPSRKSRKLSRSTKFQQLEQRLAQVESQLASNSPLQAQDDEVGDVSGLLLSTEWEDDGFWEPEHHSTCDETIPHKDFLHQTTNKATGQRVPHNAIKQGVPTSKEFGISKQDQHELTRLYFELVHHSYPILHPRRFKNMSTKDPPHMPSEALKYIVWAMASRVSPMYANLSEELYLRGREIVEELEKKGSDSDMLCIALTQTWFLIAGYEANQNYLPKAWFSVGISARFAIYQNLHMIDRRDVSSDLAMDTQGISEREERRRTFWGVYQAETWSCAMADRMSTFRDEDIWTRLPCSEAAFENDCIEATPFLQEKFAARNISGLSLYAATSFATAILARCRPAWLREGIVSRGGERQDSESERYLAELDVLISTILLDLPSRSAISPEDMIKHLIFLLLLHCVNIILHRAIMDRAIQQQMADKPYLLISFKRCLISAQVMRDVVAGIQNLESSPLPVWTGFCLSTAGEILVQDSVIFNLSTRSPADLGLLLVVLKLIKNKLADSYANTLQKRIFEVGLQRSVYNTLQAIT